MKKVMMMIMMNNYIIKMSNIKKGDWCIIFDSLYYNFINKNQDKLLTIYSTANSVNNWNKKNNKKEIINIAKKYINEYV
jgi:deoxyribodipyrimidine photolyase-related protein